MGELSILYNSPVPLNWRFALCTSILNLYYISMANSLPRGAHSSHIQIVGRFRLCLAVAKKIGRLAHWQPQPHNLCIFLVQCKGIRRRCNYLPARLATVWRRRRIRRRQSGDILKSLEVFFRTVSRFVASCVRIEQNCSMVNWLP